MRRLRWSEKGILPDQLEIAKVTPLFKKGDNALMDNYHPLSVLPCFSKVLERIIYNKLYSFFSVNILYKKHLGFQKQHSTDHAIVHLNDWFCANKLSLNTDKTKYVLFLKAKSMDNLPLVLPDLFINDVKIKRENSLKFLGVYDR